MQMLETMTGEREHATQPVATGTNEASVKGAKTGLLTFAELTGNLSSNWSIKHLFGRAMSQPVQVLDINSSKYPDEYPGAQTPIQARMIVEVMVEITDIARKLEPHAPALREWRELSNVTFTDTGAKHTVKVQFTNSIPSLNLLKQVGVPIAGVVEQLRPAVERGFFHD
jgi:hypothetical protein